MIKVRAESKRSWGYMEYEIKPTMFPDGTSQIWKLPESLITATDIQIVWNFESEREIIDLYSLNRLLNRNARQCLHMPYLPYARQDKTVSNESTFNLRILAQLINNLNYDKVTAVDAHNPQEAKNWIENFENISVSPILHKIIEQLKPSTIVFPDKGAQHRYGGYLQGLPTIYCEKMRDQLTGAITSIEPKMGGLTRLLPGQRLLIVDDICDRGGTFMGVAQALKKIEPNLHITLFVTHGIFSGGKEIIHAAGIDEILTTNSLIKNIGGYEV